MDGVSTAKRNKQYRHVHYDIVINQLECTYVLANVLQHTYYVCGDTSTLAHDHSHINKYCISGIVKRVKRNTWEITEVPYGFDREQMFTKLIDLEESDKLQDFEDECSKIGFKFNSQLKTILFP